MPCASGQHALLQRTSTVILMDHDFLAMYCCWQFACFQAVLLAGPCMSVNMTSILRDVFCMALQPDWITAVWKEQKDAVLPSDTQAQRQPKLPFGGKPIQERAQWGGGRGGGMQAGGWITAVPGLCSTCRRLLAILMSACTFVIGYLRWGQYMDAFLSCALPSTTGWLCCPETLHTHTSNLALVHALLQNA